MLVIRSIRYISGRFWAGSTYRGRSKDDHKIDPAWEMTKGSVLHSFAEKECPSCDGKGRERCDTCWETGEIRDWG